MTGKRVMQLALLGVVILLLGGCVTGAIGSAIFGRDALLPTPGVHLPPQLITGAERGSPIGTDTGFALTNTVLSSFVTSIVLVLLFWLGTSKLSVVPGRLQSVIELIVEGLLNFMESIIGAVRARSLFPLIATIFLFVAFNSWLGLIPVYQSYGITRWNEVNLSELSAAHVETHDGESVISVEELKHIVTARVAEELEHEGIEKAAAEKKAEKIAHVANVQISDEGSLTKQLSHVRVEANRFVGTAAEKIEAAGGETKVAKAGLSATFVRPAGTDINMPLALAIISFVFVEGLGLRSFKLGYMEQFIPVKRVLKGDVMALVIGIIELFSHFIRMVSFTFRLFGNMAAGEILVLLSAFLVPFIITVVVYGLELFVGLIQGIVFAGLTLVFASVALTPHHEEHEEGHQAGTQAQPEQHGGGH